MMRLYVVQNGSMMLVDNQRDIKIGYYHQHANGSETKYYLAATEEDNYEVSATEVRKCIIDNKRFMHFKYTELQL